MRKKTVNQIAVLLLLTASLLLTACAGDSEPTIPPLFEDRTTAATGDEVPEPTLPETVDTEPVTTEPPVTEAPTDPPKEEPDDVQGEVSWNQGVMLLNDRALEIFGISEASINSYADRINRFQAALPSGINVVSMVSPTAGEFYTPAEFHTGSHSQKEAIQMIYNQLNDGIITVDSYDPLLQHTDEYIYYRSDHHWTGLGAYYGYAALMEAIGIEPRPLSDYQEYALSGSYLGSLWRFAQGNENIKNNPDTVYMYKPDDYNAKAWVYNTFDLVDGYAMHLLATQFEGDEKYLSFSGGDAPILAITSEAGTGRTCVVIKDSYANALVPHLANHYDEAYIIDPRAVEGSIVEFITRIAPDDVIVMNYAFAYANPTWNERFEALFS